MNENQPSSLRQLATLLNKVFARDGHDLSVINSIFAISVGAIALVGAQVHGWFHEQIVSTAVAGIFVHVLLLLAVYVAASNQPRACQRFAWYIVAAAFSAIFPWTAMYLTAHDLAPQYAQLWLYPIGLASWALTREFAVLLGNALRAVNKSVNPGPQGEA